jgi:hypothetical protein
MAYVELSHTVRRPRSATVLGRAATWATAHAPHVWSWTRAAAVRARRVVLTVAGLACITAAAWTVAVALGLLTAGVSLLVFEFLSADD